MSKLSALYPSHAEVYPSHADVPRQDIVRYTPVTLPLHAGHQTLTLPRKSGRQAEEMLSFLVTCNDPTQDLLHPR